MGCCGGYRRIEKAKSVPTLTVAAATAHAEKTTIAAPPERIEKRISICKSCPYQQKDMCHRCGCVLVMKVGSEKERCPINRW